MAANSSAHSARAGYNQSGGAYFVCVTALSGSSGVGVTPVTVGVDVATTAGATHLYRIATLPAKSGGAFEPAVLAPVSAVDVLGGALWSGAEAKDEFAAGQLIRDMGKTVVDKEGRTFRKFAVVGQNRVNGVEGGPQAAPGLGYGTFYLDVGRATTTGGVPAPIARYF